MVVLTRVLNDVFVGVFNRLLRRYRATSPKGGAYIPIPEKTIMRMYSTDNQHGNLAPPLSVRGGGAVATEESVEDTHKNKNVLNKRLIHVCPRLFRIPNRIVYERNL